MLGLVNSIPVETDGSWNLSLSPVGLHTLKHTHRWSLTPVPTQPRRITHSPGTHSHTPWCQYRVTPPSPMLSLSSNSVLDIDPLPASIWQFMYVCVSLIWTHMCAGVSFFTAPLRSRHTLTLTRFSQSAFSGFFVIFIWWIFNEQFWRIFSYGDLVIFVFGCIKG